MERGSPLRVHCACEAWHFELYMVVLEVGHAYSMATNAVLVTITKLY